MKGQHRGGFLKGVLLFSLGLGAGLLTAKYFLRSDEAENCYDEDCCCVPDLEEETYHRIQVEPLSDEEV